MKKDALLDAALLALASWAAVFLHAASFGLYEDDWARVPQTASLSWAGFGDLALPFLTFAQGQGRPLHDSLIYLFSFVGWKLGGLSAMYAIGWAIFAANAVLFYFLLRRVAQVRAFALAGALAFCLFPADTTRAFLTHALGVQPSCTFLLIACHLWISGRRAWAYVAACGCLLSYETFFPLFFALPLASEAWRRWGAWVRHGATMGAILCADVLVRRVTGESRVAGLGAAALAASMESLRTGPVTVLRIFVHAPRLVLEHFSVELGVAFAVCFFLTAAMLWKRGAQKHSWARIASMGAAMVVLAYPLALTGGSGATLGRGTRAHAPAAVGVSILCGCAVAAGVERRRRAAAVTAGLFFATLLAEGLVVQHEFARAWSMETAFWQKFDALPVGDSDVFLFDAPPDTAAISAYSWSMALIPEVLYEVPKEWKNPPRVFVSTEAWRARICSGEGLFESNDWVLKYEPRIADGYRGAAPVLHWIARDGATGPLCGPGSVATGRALPKRSVYGRIYGAAISYSKE